MMDIEIINDNEINNKIKTHPCENCKEPQLTELDLKNHMKSCSKIKEEITIEEDQNKDEKGKKNSSKRKKEGTKNLISCNFCDKDIPLPILTSHIDKVHSNLENFQCKICSKSFKGIGGMRKHVRHVHLGIKNVKCNHCPKSFASNSVLKLHINSTHLKVKFPCNLCNETYAYYQGLIRHKRIKHYGEKKFICGFCIKLCT